MGSVPVGEYLFDFRSANVSVNGQTFAEWYINEYMFGPTGLGNANISGFCTLGERKGRATPSANTLSTPPPSPPPNRHG